MTPTKEARLEQAAGSVCAVALPAFDLRQGAVLFLMQLCATQAHKRERAVLGELVGMPAQESLKKRKKVQKAQNRRVSFAPDNQLETMHLFIKVRRHRFLLK